MKDFSYVRTVPIKDWSGEQLAEAFWADMISKSDYEDENHRRGFGAGPSIKRLEELSKKLTK